MKLAVVDKLPVGGVDVIVANDIDDGDILRNPVVKSRTGEEPPVDYVEDRSVSYLCRHTF